MEKKCNLCGQDDPAEFYAYDPRCKKCFLDARSRYRARKRGFFLKAGKHLYHGTIGS